MLNREKIIKILNNWSIWYNAQAKTVRYSIIAFSLLGIWMFSGVISRLIERSEVKVLNQPNYSILHSIAEKKNAIVKLSGIAEMKDVTLLVGQDNGFVTQVLVEDGQFVKKDTKLLQIESKNYNENLQKALALYQAEEIEMKAAEILMQKRLISESDFIKTKSDFYAAEAALIQAKLNLEHSYVVAPFDGYVNHISVKVGDYLYGIGMGNGGVVGTFFHKNRDFIVKASLSEHDRARVKVSQAALIIFDDEQVNAKLSYLSSVKNSNNNSFEAEFTIENPLSYDVSGQSVEVIIFGNQFDAHKVPQSTLSLDSDGRIGLKILDNERVVQFYEVNILQEERDGVWVAGLPNEVDVITLGHAYIKPLAKLE